MRRPFTTPFLLASALLATACTQEIQRGIDQPQGDEIVVALSRAGVPAELDQDDGQGQGPPTYHVTVSATDAAHALAVLAADGLPRQAPAGYGTVYGDGSLVPTETEERARYAWALSGEIEDTLLRVDGTLDARVHLVLPDPDAARDAALGGPPAPRAQASVLLKLAAGAPALSAADVQRLVAGAVPGLLPDDVAVVSTVASTPERPQDPLTRVGPLWIATGSRGALVAVLATLLLVVVGLSLALVLMARRLRAHASASSSA
jgi:type III secretion protein J